MCNRFGDPVCSAHEPALRTAVDHAREKVLRLAERLQTLDAQTSADPHQKRDELGALYRLWEAQQGDLRLEHDAVNAQLREAQRQLLVLQTRHDQTKAGLRDLRAMLAAPGLSDQARHRIAARCALAENRRAAALARWQGSSAWAENRLHDTADPDRYIDLLARRRAAENGVMWPPPGGAARAGWELTAAAATLTALVERELPHPQVTFSVPEVIDSRYRQPPHDGWDPLAAAHFVHLPNPLFPPGPAPLMHQAAHTGKSWKVSRDEMCALLRAQEGGRFVDDAATVPVHDAVAGQQWVGAPIVGPVQLLSATGTTLGNPCYTGWVLMRVNDARLITTDHTPAAAEAS